MFSCQCFFFFQQETAYEMRISEWSSTCTLPIYFQIADVVQEQRVAGGQQYRPLAAVGNRRADGITQAGTETAEVLVPDHVMRLGLQEGPGVDHGAAAVARVDRVLWHRLGRFDDPLGSVKATALGL